MLYIMYAKLLILIQFELDGSIELLIFYSIVPKYEGADIHSKHSMLTELAKNK